MRPPADSSLVYAVAADTDANLASMGSLPGGYTALSTGAAPRILAAYKAASAPLSGDPLTFTGPSNGWAVFGVVLKDAPAGTAPVITSATPGSVHPLDPVTVTGGAFGASQGTSIVTVNGVLATPVYWSDTAIVVPTPVGAATGSLVVMVDGHASNGWPVTVSGNPPAFPIALDSHQELGNGGGVSSIASPATNRSTGATVIATVAWRYDTAPALVGVTNSAGQAFDCSRHVATMAAFPVTLCVLVNATGNANDVITAQFDGATTGSTQLVVDTFVSTTTRPALDFASVSAGFSGTYALDGGVTTTAAPSLEYAVASDADSTLTSAVSLPSGFTTPAAGGASRILTAYRPVSSVLSSEPLTLYGPSNGWVLYGVALKEAPAEVAPVITSITPAGSPAIQAFTISGTGFGTTQGASAVAISGAAAAVVYWSNTSVVALVPSGVTSGTVTVTASGLASNGVALNGSAPNTTINLTSPAPNSTFGVQSPVTLIADVTSSASITSVTFYASGVAIGTRTTAPYQLTWTPTLAGAYALSASVLDGGGQVTTSADVGITVAVLHPSITSVSPTNGRAGTQVVIAGESFGASQGNSRIWIGTRAANVVSWSDSQIVANVAPGSETGVVQVLLAAATSNSVSFSVITPTITTVSPNSGPAGTVVTITGSGFGDTQQSGQVLLGNAPGAPTAWSDTHVTATVAPGARSGAAQILQNGVLSNSTQFTVTGGNPVISEVWPTSGTSGTTITIYGTDFGSSASGNTIVLSGIAATVTSWSDTSISATVPVGAITGLLKVQRQGLWSNAVSFRVPVANGTQVTVSPSQMSMLVGETRSIQALQDNGAAASGQIWSSSDTSIVSLSSDDPPILTAEAVGTVTISAGSASAEVNVYPGSDLPVGAVVWSLPTGASGGAGLYVAAPNYDTVADVFANYPDDTVQAITTDGMVAWTVALPQSEAGANLLFPDFQGGLVVWNRESIYRLDGATGQASAGYHTSSGESKSIGLGYPAIHTNGLVFSVDSKCSYCGNDIDTTDGAWIIGVDPNAGTEQFRVSTVNSTDSSTVNDMVFCQSDSSSSEWHAWPSAFIIAGDGYAYLSYQSVHSVGTANRSSTQHWPDDAYDIFDQLQRDTGNSDFGAALNDLAALTEFANPDPLPLGLYLWGALQQGDRTQAIQIENGMYAMYVRPCDSSGSSVTKMHLMRVGPNGDSSDVVVKEWSEQHSRTFVATGGFPYYHITVNQDGPQHVNVGHSNIITDADQGALFSWLANPEVPDRPVDPEHLLDQPEYHLTTMRNGVIGADVRWEEKGQYVGAVIPELQLEDGSFAGDSENGLLVFDAAGTVKWNLPGAYAVVATPEAGLIASAGATWSSFDANGSAVGFVGQPQSTQSWLGDQYGPGAKRVIGHPFVAAGASFWPQPGGNPSGNYTAKTFESTDMAALVALNSVWNDSWKVVREYGGRICRTATGRYISTGPISQFDSGEIVLERFLKARCRPVDTMTGDFHTHVSVDQPYPSGLVFGTSGPTDIGTANAHPELKYFVMTKPLLSTDANAICPALGCFATNSVSPARSIYKYQGSFTIPNNAINNVWQKLPTRYRDPNNNGGWIVFPRQ